MIMVSAASVAAKDWRGILPMHSTREDVEAALGPPPPSRNPDPANRNWSVYLFDDFEIYIHFITQDKLVQQNCDSTVAAGTVSLIRLTPKNDVLVGEFTIDEKSFRKIDLSQPDDPGHQAFIDEKDGFIIHAIQGKAREVLYVPSAADRQRCPTLFGNLEDLVRIPKVVCGKAFDEYGDIRFSDEKARLDNFSIQLLNVEDAVGYIIAYAGRKATVAEAQLRANRARDYLINVRKFNPERLKAIDGGHREELMVTLYVLPHGVAPPVVPTVPASEVEIIYPKTRSRTKGN